MGYKIIHSAKGTSWEKKDHKYISKETKNGKTVYKYSEKENLDQYSYDVNVDGVYTSLKALMDPYKVRVKTEFLTDEDIRAMYGNDLTKEQVANIRKTNTSFLAKEIDTARKSAGIKTKENTKLASAGKAITNDIAKTFNNAVKVARANQNKEKYYYDRDEGEFYTYKEKGWDYDEKKKQHYKIVR